MARKKLDKIHYRCALDCCFPPVLKVNLAENSAFDLKKIIIVHPSSCHQIERRSIRFFHLLLCCAISACKNLNKEKTAFSMS